MDTKCVYLYQYKTFFPGPHPAFTARRPAENRCYVKKFTYDVIFFTYDVIFFT